MTDFLQWFVRRCAATNIEKSDAEERNRYHKNPPYHQRISKWIDKFYKPNHGFDDSEDA